MKQTWLLKKLEEQRESMQKKPQFLGLKGSPNSTNSRIGPKASHLNQMLNAMNSNLQDRGILRFQSLPSLNSSQ